MKLVVIFILATTFQSLAEVRLLAVWQEYFAGVIAGRNNAARTGSKGVPGGRTLVASMSDVGVQGNSTAAQKAELLDGGFKLTGKVDASYTGEPASIVADCKLVIEFAVTGDEKLAISSNSVITENESSDRDTHITVFEGTRDIVIDDFNTTSIVPLRSSGVATYNYSTGIYRLTIWPSIMYSSSPPPNSGHYWTEFDITLKFTNYIISPGALQSHPLLPDTAQTFVAAPSRRWFDPPLADGFIFTGTGATEFEEIIDFPSGFSSKFQIYVDGNMVGESSDGDSFNFKEVIGAPVKKFEIRNIQPFVDGTSPTAFPIMLRFAEETGSFTMRPIETPSISLTPEVNGDLRLEFFGTLQQSSSLLSDSWVDVSPQPKSPWIIKKSEAFDKKFFRSQRK